MSCRFALLTILSLILLLTTSCKSDKTTSVVPKPTSNVADSTIEETSPADQPVILFYGNSLTAGYGLEEDQSFPSRIEDTLAAQNLQYTVVNAGLSGETTSGGLQRIDWVLRQRVDIFLLELGANDMLRGLPLEETKANLIAIIDKVQAKYPDAQIILMEMLAAPNMGEEYQRDFRQIYSDIASGEAVPLLPFFLDGVAGNPDLLLPDGKHPNADGQLIVADNVWRFLKGYL